MEAKLKSTKQTDPFSKEKKILEAGERSFKNGIINSIRYVKDPRTNICFACVPAGRGSSLTTVPCDSIPPELLTVAEIK